MLVRLISDTHLECYRNKGSGGVRKIVEAIPGNADLLVIAGDFAQISALQESQVVAALRTLASRNGATVYVPGNHEYYQNNPAGTDAALAEMCAAAGVGLMGPGKMFTVGGLKVTGATLWFPKRPDPYHAAGLMNDFTFIRDLEPWVYEQNGAAHAWLGSEEGRADIVVTHHMPSYRSTPSRFIGSVLNRFFISDCEDLINGQAPKLWLHGHTHDGCDYKLPNRLGETRVVCEPMGYPSERRDRDRPSYVGALVEV